MQIPDEAKRIINFKESCPNYLEYQDLFEHYSYQDLLLAKLALTNNEIQEERIQLKSYFEYIFVLLYK